MATLYSGLVLFVLTSIVSSQFPNFIVREIGSSINFTCPADSTKNYTYKFSTLKKPLITPGARITLYGHILMIVDLEWGDSDQYFCSIYDSNGKQIRGNILLAILSLKQATRKYSGCYIFDCKAFHRRSTYSKPDSN